MGYIYCITNLINSKKYVGKTLGTILKRWKEHCQDSLRERYSKRPLYDAMNKYGIENFKIEELEYVEDPSILSKKEIYWINEIGSYGHRGYNATKGGDGSILYDHNEILELARLGYTTLLIVDKIHCCKDIVYKVTKAHGVKLRNGSSKLIALFDLAGNYIQTFFGSGDAQQWLLDNGIVSNKNAKAHIKRCCAGKEKMCYGYKWTYLENPK